MSNQECIIRIHDYLKERLDADITLWPPENLPDWDGVLTGILITINLTPVLTINRTLSHGLYYVQVLANTSDGEWVVLEPMLDIEPIGSIDTILNACREIALPFKPEPEPGLLHAIRDDLRRRLVLQNIIKDNDNNTIISDPQDNVLAIISPSLTPPIINVTLFKNMEVTHHEHHPTDAQSFESLDNLLRHAGVKLRGPTTMGAHRYLRYG